MLNYSKQQTLSEYILNISGHGCIHIVNLSAPPITIHLPTTPIVFIHAVAFFNTQLHKGGTMVPNIWFFGSRILTPQYFWLIIFVIA